MRRFLFISIIGIFMFVQPTYADVGIAPSDSQVLAKLDALADQLADLQKVVSDQQALILQQAEEISALKTTAEFQRDDIYAPPPSAVRPTEKNAFLDSLFGSVPWIEGLQASGDYRLRMENFKFFDADATKGTNDRDRTRFRQRLRIAVDKEWNDALKLHTRFATGSISDPTSTNQTLDGQFTNKNFNLDRAFVTYNPQGIKDSDLFNTGIILKNLTLGGGKFKNPFTKYATVNVWDDDVNPEGIYESADFLLFENPNRTLTSTVQLGQMVVDEGTGTNADAELYAYQAGATYAADLLKMGKRQEITGALSYYQYVNYFDTIGALQRTNFPASRSPQVLDYYTDIKLDLWDRPVTVFGNFTKNVSDTVAANSPNEKPANGDEAYGVGLKYGKTKERGDWDMSYGYYYLEANATAAAFNDADFGGPGGAGGTNRKGHKFQLSYKLTDSLVAKFTGFVVTPVHDVSAARQSTAEKVFRAQSDLSFKF